MTTAFKSDRHARVFNSVLTELKVLGYSGELLRQDYQFGDWFLPDRPQRSAPAAAFGRTPLSYASACFAVVLPNERSGGELVSEYRALGAPFAIEVGEQEVSVWGVGPTAQAARRWLTIPIDGVAKAFKTHAADWSADSILRAKNISDTVRSRQLDFIDLGLIPALEEQIRTRLDELLNEVLTKTALMYQRKTGDKADEKLLFRLVFRLFAAKVLHDREVAEFAEFTMADGPARILRAVGKFYQQQEAVLDQHEAQATALSLLWERVNFQNLSVEVLAYIYENTLVSQSSRRRLGTHSTPSSIARYLIGKLPFKEYPQSQRIVVEPCSGHAVLLVAAMHRLGELLPPTMDPVKRHQYLVQMLHGYEIDTFALEVGKLCMMLADFPNANGWKLENKDVFISRLFTDSLREARFVICNPPFEDFEAEHRELYRNISAVQRPVELLNRILDHLHPKGCLGFVLPRVFLDGRAYSGVRERIARRFRQVEVVGLPDRIFHKSTFESALLVATQPRSEGKTTTISYGEVWDRDRASFLRTHQLSRWDVRTRSCEAARDSFVIAPHWDVWQSIKSLPKLGSVAKFHRGLQWQNFSSERCYSPTQKPKFVSGYALVQQKMIAYQESPREFLYVGPDTTHRACLRLRGPKVVANAIRIDRESWRLAAFVDLEDNALSQNFIGVWPSTEQIPAECLAAVLNGPLVNLLLDGLERGKHNQIRTLKSLPIPDLTPECWQSIKILVREYEALASIASMPKRMHADEMASIIYQIDAIVLSGYGLAPHIEQKVLGSFSGEARPVSFAFTQYNLEHFSAVRAVGGRGDVAARLSEMKKRRTLLAARLLDGTITPVEDAELAEIDKSLDRYVDTITPLPFDLLERLEAEARRQGADGNE